MCVKSSYLLDIIPYLGKSDQDSKNAKILGQQIVESLAKDFYGSKRNIAMDNFFTSIPFAKNLFENKLTLVGTLRHNKAEIPKSFLANKTKQVYSSQFAFDKFMTLVSSSIFTFINFFFRLFPGKSGVCVTYLRTQL